MAGLETNLKNTRPRPHHLETETTKNWSCNLHHWLHVHCDRRHTSALKIRVPKAWYAFGWLLIYILARGAQVGGSAILKVNLIDTIVARNLLSLIDRVVREDTLRHSFYKTIFKQR